MLTIPNVTTADGYTEACTLEDVNAVAATYVVANAAVIAQFRPKRPDGTLAPYGPELLLSPQSNNMVAVGGMRFRSAIAGAPAQIVAAMYDRDDPLPGAATPFSQTISASGAVTPGLAAVQIQKDGVLIGSESVLDFLTVLGMTKITATDDLANKRIVLTFAPAVIADASPGAPASTVDIQNIPTTPSHLKAFIAARTDRAASAFDGLVMRCNNDTSLNYHTQYDKSVATTMAAAESLSANGVLIDNIIGGNLGGGRVASVEITLIYPEETGDPISGHFQLGAIGNPVSGGMVSEKGAFIYNVATAPVSRITFLPVTGPNFVVGTRFTLQAVPPA